jgi:hypothetical protein
LAGDHHAIASRSAPHCQAIATQLAGEEIATQLAGEEHAIDSRSPRNRQGINT